MKKISLIFIVAFFLCGCSMLKLPGLPTPKKPQTVYNWHEISNIKPRAVVAGKKVVIVEDTSRELIVGYHKVEMKKTFSQKIGSWISGLGFLGIILLIAGLVLAPSATIGFLFSTLGKWKKAMKQTVSAIKESRAVDADVSLKTSLSGKQSKETKKIVDGIKREI